MATYSGLTFAIGLILTAVQVVVNYVLPDEPSSDWWVLPLVMLILTFVMTIVVGRIINRRGQNDEY